MATGKNVYSTLLEVEFLKKKKKIIIIIKMFFLSLRSVFRAVIVIDAGTPRNNIGSNGHLARARRVVMWTSHDLHRTDKTLSTYKRIRLQSFSYLVLIADFFFSRKPKSVQTHSNESTVANTRSVMVDSCCCALYTHFCTRKQ
jgi:hypothetical protein